MATNGGYSSMIQIGLVYFMLFMHEVDKSAQLLLLLILVSNFVCIPLLEFFVARKI